MAFYGNVIDGDGATEESVGWMPSETLKILAAEAAAEVAVEPTSFDIMRDTAFAEYDEDLVKLQTNYDAAVARAEAALAKGGKYAQSDYDRWMASAQRYADLTTIEAEILQTSLNVATIKETISKIPTQFTSSSYTGTTPFYPTMPKGSTPTTPTKPVSPTPTTPTQPSAPIVPPPPVKTAPIDTILFDAEDTLPIEIMADLIFENIGGQELINIARNDTINGQQVIYQPIKNLTQIQQQYNPNNILSVENTSNRYFENFPLEFNSKVPLVGSGPNGEHIYIDPDTGSLIIDVVNIESDEQIELEVVTSGTIYEAVI